MRRPRRVPTVVLPRSGEHFRGGVAASAVVHVALVALIVVVGSRVTGQYYRAIGLPGPAGGGGGGGRPYVRYVELPPLAGVRRAEAPLEQPQEAVELTLPKPELAPIDAPEPKVVLPMAVQEVADVPVLGRGPGTGGGVGAGTGSGGGIGSGQGTGVGAGVGPGSGGGEGGEVLPPEPKFIVVPADRPRSVRGREFRVHFWVDASGKVTRVEVEPEIPDAGYRRRFMEQMSQYQFTPARTLDGRPVNGRITIPFNL